MKWLARIIVGLWHGPRPRRTAAEYRMAAAQARPVIPEVAKFFDRRAKLAAIYEALD